MNNLPLLSVLRQLACIHFPQSVSVHCIHSCTNCPSIRSSSYNPKQTAHSPLEISASCRPTSRSLFLLAWFSLLASFSSALRRLSASRDSAFFLLFSSLSCAFFFLSACFFCLSSAFSFFSSSLSNLFLPSPSSVVPLLALLPSSFSLSLLLRQ